MSHDDYDEHNAVSQEMSGRVHAVTETNQANESAKGDVKPLNDLQLSLKEKFVAETRFVSGPQTHKTDAETTLLEVRKLEAQAEINRLEVEKERLRIDGMRLEAEREFTEGPRSFRETMDGRAAKSTAFLNYFSVLGKVIFILFNGSVLGIFAYLFFVFFRR